MNNQRKNYIGIDVSKLWFDSALLSVENHVKQSIIKERFENTQNGLKLFGKWLKKHGVIFDSETLVLIENTGVYHRHIESYCANKKLRLHIGNAARIKWSLGITRGKDDKTDSERLCKYAYKESGDLIDTLPANPLFSHLKDLMTARTKLLGQFNSIKVHLNELKQFNSKELQASLEMGYEGAKLGIKESIKAIEKQIQELIKEDQTVNENYNLLLTIPGIGHLTAIYLICYTNNFTMKISGKQLASYAGVVPFGFQSGSSIKGRFKVHKMANKDLKKLLHLCALSIIKYNPEFNNYYNRKKEEGKHSLSVINAIKNKILLRVVAVINKKEPYVEQMKIAA